MESEIIQTSVKKIIDDISLPKDKEPRDILAQWTLELMKKAEGLTQLKGGQKLLVVQSTLLSLLQKHHEVFQSSSLQKIFVTEEVPVIVATSIALTKDPMFRSSCFSCIWK